MIYCIAEILLKGDSTMNSDVKASLDRYANEHCPTGGFLQAVLENNLMEAMGRADDFNRVALFDICSYIYNHLPVACHGSPEKVKRWLNVIIVTPSDIGRWVLYRPKNEKGRIKSYNDKFIFVVYKCDNNWDDYQNYTGEATKRENLEFTEAPV